MRRFFPIFAALLLIAIAAYIAIQQKEKHAPSTQPSGHTASDIGDILPQRSCARSPQFLSALKIPQPVMIDLSQKRFKGIAMLYGRDFAQVLHPKQWEQYGYLGTYAADPSGDLYLVPMPFISIEPTTFNLQKNIYKLDSKTGKLSLWMHFDDVHPSANNPYGLNTVAYDCDDQSLWIGAIDESDYSHEKGVIYHIDPKSRKILQRVEGIDALSMRLIKTPQGKYLLIGSAKKSVLYAYPVTNGMLQKAKTVLLSLPDPTLRIRKIKVKEKNRLQLQSIPFSYTLIAQSGEKDRSIYAAQWYPDEKRWVVKKAQ
jgi:hypothetical protein